MAASWNWVFFVLVVCSSGIVAPTTQGADCRCIARCDCICECGSGADCPNGPPCCPPCEVLHHASCTFKCFYQNQNKAPGSCDSAAGTDTLAPTTQGARCRCIARCDCIIYACGAGADCGSIQPNGTLCCLPNEVLHHASYTFKCFYQNQNKVPGSCDFAAGTDPSYGYCICTSSAAVTCTSSTPSPPATKTVTAPPTSYTAPTPLAAPPTSNISPTPLAAPPNSNTAPTPLAAPPTPPPNSNTAPTPLAAPPTPPPTSNTPTPLPAPPTSSNGVVNTLDTSTASLHSFSLIPLSLIFLLFFSTYVI